MQETKVGLRAHIWNHCLSHYYGINAYTAFGNADLLQSSNIFFVKYDNIFCQIRKSLE